MRIVLTTLGVDYASAKLMGLSLAESFALMKVVGQTIELQTKRRIVSEKTDPMGKAWAPLKASTLSKKRNSNAGDILVDTGRLLASVSHQASPMQAEIGARVHYAKYHQYGTKKMAQRAFLGVSKSNARELDVVIAAYFAAKVKAA